MEEDQEQKHCCRFCNKRFQCGRSLGGHMRSHMTMNSSEAEEKSETRKGSVNGGSSSKSLMGFQGYGLRENPKKTWRLSDLSAASQQERTCKECGKVFQSWKALFGHLRCHANQEDTWSRAGGESCKLVFDDDSDKEGLDLPAMGRRRSRRLRHGASHTFSNSNGYSSVSVIEQEQDVAISLVMLSRDLGSWGGPNSVAESSDNNSDALETPSSLTVKSFIARDEEFVRKSNSNFCKKSSEMGISDDGYLKNAANSDASDDVFKRDGQFFYKTRLDHDASDSEMRKDSSKSSRPDFSHIELRRKKIKSNLMDIELGKHSCKDTRYDPLGLINKRERYESYGTELENEHGKKIRFEASEREFGKDQCRKKSQFECTTCNKIFYSYQALGGHRASHKKVKGCFKTESSENSFNYEFSSNTQADDRLRFCKIEKLLRRGNVGYSGEEPKRKKNKGHECPICLKVFASGQALGGHKKSHLITNTDNKSENCQTIVIQQHVPEITDLPDLNLPAPVEEDVNGFIPWWAGSSRNCEQEPAIALIAN